MKTPQEQAEQLYLEAIDKIEASNSYSELRHIPLPELIAVAQAADVILTDYMTYFVDWERMANDKSYKPEYPDNVLKAQAALQALRATGKVEL